jgi:RNA polymerase sigma factor (sigma-70 family)
MLHCHRSNPPDHAAAAQMRSRLASQIERLTPRQAEVARMVLLEEWPLVEVASALGIGVKRVERHMAKARARLRQLSVLGRGDCGGGEKGG